MHFYWRIIEELKYLGEDVVINDPNLSREYNSWVKKNLLALMACTCSNKRAAPPVFKVQGISVCLN